MSDKYLYQADDGIKEQEALATSTGASDAGKIPALDNTGRLDSTMMPIGIGADTKVLPASENLAAGDMVNVWNDGGTAKVRKADASGGRGKRADGFVLSAVTSGNNATVYFEGIVTGLSGLTPGAKYWLSATPGALTTTIPTTTGHIAQSVGKAISATELSFEPGDEVLRA